MNDTRDPDDTHDSWDWGAALTLIDLLRENDAKMKDELEQARLGNAKVIHALDCALQLVETLIAFLPEGQPVHPGLDAAQGALREALKELRR